MPVKTTQVSMVREGVLIVDDNELNLGLVQAILTRQADFARPLMPLLAGNDRMAGEVSPSPAWNVNLF